MPGLEVVPVALRDARGFIEDHHRHSAPPRGWLFGCALEHGGQRVAVGVAGRPTARGLQDGRTVEITRVCVADGQWENACSRLYGRLCRAAAALGYVRAYTYTQEGESATSVRAAGFVYDGPVDGDRSWDTPSRRREDATLFGARRREHVARHRWRRDL